MIWSSKINALVMDSPCCEDCILHMDCKDCASPFSLDHRIPKSYTVKPFISGISEKVGGRVLFFFFKGFCTLLPFFSPFGAGRNRQNIFWEAVPDFPCGNATLSLQDIFISILSNHICRYSSQVYLDFLWCFDLASSFHLGFPVLGEQKAPFQDGLASDKDPVKEIQQFFSDALRQRFILLP